MFLFDVEVKDAGEYGLGVFTKEFIPRGSVVFKMTPESIVVYHESELQNLPERFVQDYLRKYAYGNSLGDIFFPCLNDRFLNHSITPNIGKPRHLDQLARMTADDIAFVDIQPGEQLFCDYTDLDVSTKYCSRFLHL